MNKLSGFILSGMLAAGNIAVADEIYTPGAVGTPEGRVGPGTRGSPDSSIRLAVLAPGGGSKTSSTQPVLYWYCNQPVTNVSFQLSKVVPESAQIKVLFENQLTADKPGIQQIRLADYDLNLQVGVQYEWSISLPRLPTQRMPVLALGRISLVPAEAELQSAQARAQATIYAESGLWYNAFDILQRAIAAAPDNQTLLTARQDLLQQAGLDIFNYTVTQQVNP